MEFVCCFNCEVDPDFKQHPRASSVFTFAHMHTHIMDANTEAQMKSHYQKMLGSAKVHSSALGFEIRHKQIFNECILKFSQQDYYSNFVGYG